MSGNLFLFAKIKISIHVSLLSDTPLLDRVEDEIQGGINTRFAMLPNGIP